ncbi:type IV secretion system DNA-binding domain-containing protein [Providencia hangzhouensis]|uniref:type IV secretion system DNA-binding domain-containing protein n=1 Tax=Providencia hangzhouensis TaxID=3031799 RepID=UPI0034DCF4E1
MTSSGKNGSKRFSEQYSYGKETVRDGVSFNKQQEDSDLVNYSDVQSLPDLTCYITYPANILLLNMQCATKKSKVTGSEFTARAINDSLDQEIEAEINERLKMGAHMPDGVNQVIDSLISGQPIELPVETTPNNTVTDVAQPQPIVQLSPNSTTPKNSQIATGTALIRKPNGKPRGARSGC